MEIPVPTQPVGRNLGIEGQVQKSLWASTKPPHKGPCMLRGQVGLTPPDWQAQGARIIGKTRASGFYAAGQETQLDS